MQIKLTVVTALLAAVLCIQTSTASAAEKHRTTGSTTKQMPLVMATASAGSTILSLGRRLTAGDTWLWTMSQSTNTNDNSKGSNARASRSYGRKSDIGRRDYDPKCCHYDKRGTCDKHGGWWGCKSSNSATG